MDNATINVGRSASSPGLTVVNAYEIVMKNLPPTRWIVSPILHEGAALLSGDPKVGKSFLALQIALAVAGSSNTVFGTLNVETHGRVLYLSFDDASEKRLQKRFGDLNADDEAVKNIDFVYKDGTLSLSTGLCDQLAELLKKQRYELVILDTLGTVLSEATDKKVYTGEYKEAIKLQKLALDKDICLLLIHHTNKAQRKGKNPDPIAKASGSHGLTGAVDSVLLLSASGKDAAKLVARPRDGEETEQSLRRLPNGGWTATSRQADLDALLNMPPSKASCPTQDAVLEALASGPKTKKELAEIIGISEEAIRKRVDRLGRKRIEKLRDGRYGLCSVQP